MTCCPGNEFVTDPVCGMRVDPHKTPHRAEHEGAPFYFCGAGCRTKFLADPTRYLAPVPPPEEAGPSGGDVIYTCPMHPEVRQNGPGSCPICGMALEPLVAGEANGPNPELVDMQRRLLVAVLLSVPLVALEMGSHLLGSGHMLARGLMNWVQLALATPVVLWAGWPFFVRGWQSLLSRNLNMFTLIAMGTGIAWLYSVAATALPGLFPPAFRAHDGSVAVYFEAAAVIVALVLLGQVLELRARENAGGAIRALMDLSPKSARRLAPDGAERDVPVESVAVGDVLRVRPGERIPVDGSVTEGSGAVDESTVTGESMPVTKSIGARVLAGSLNQAGGFLMRAESVGRDTLLARIIQLVSEAQRSRAPIQRVADRVSAIFVPAVIGVALVAFVAWAMFGPEPPLAYGVVAAVSVLIIACPCALGLATPMSIMVGIGRAARAGVLVRKAEALEILERADVLVVDKTGTLTEGRPAVTAILPAPGFDEEIVLRAAAAVERASEHPLAAAIVRAAEERKLGPGAVSDFRSASGKGVAGLVDGRRVAVGNALFLAGEGIEAGEAPGASDALAKQGATVIFVAIDGEFAGALAVADPLRATSAEVLATLRRQGVDIVMLTGDVAATARAVAARLGIDRVEAGVLPQGKQEVVRRLRSGGRTVAMAGDGINDAPALAEADIGIAMGTGTDVAIESAGIVLLKGDLAGILRARKLSRATMRNIRQNLFLAFVYNALGVPIAAGILYPAFGILLSPIVAAAAMSLSSVSVIANALRLRRLELR